MFCKRIDNGVSINLSQNKTFFFFFIFALKCCSWTALIKENIFEKAKERLSKNKDRYKPDSYKRHPYVLSGILKCGICGDNLVGKSSYGSTKKHFYYSHGSQIRKNSVTKNPGCRCPLNSIRAELLEKSVMNRIKELIGQPNVVNLFIDRVKEDQNTFTVESKIKVQKKKLNDHQYRIETLLSHLETLPKGSKANSIYERLTGLEEKKMQLKEELNQLETDLMTQTEIIEPEAYIGFLKRIATHIEAASPNMQRRLLRAVIEKIVAHKGHAEAYYFAGKEVVERCWEALDSSKNGQGRIAHKKNFINDSNTLTKSRGERI